MKREEYAIVDIETTGGSARNGRITEIAIIIHDGVQTLKRWETLVNPQQQIPNYIVALTGISDDTIATAPVFETIAEQVFELLKDRTFVAHNVNFDYSFVRHQLQLSGFNLTSRKLCTVRASRKIRPGFSSYSLGNLCQSLGISVENRHRAGGDADATALLFSKLVAWDTEGFLDKMIKKTAKDQQLPPHLSPEDFEKLPNCPGVYYFHDNTGKVIYVGKAVNIKKRVASHFSGNNVSSQRQNFLREIYNISFEECATELMALLLECSEIQKLWPIYNKALKQFEPKFALYHYEARNGYSYLAIGKLSKFQAGIEEFHREIDAIDTLRNLVKKYAIDLRFCNFGRPPENIQQNVTKIPLPEKNDHNLNVEQALQDLRQQKPTYFIVDRGKNPDEKSCIWVESGKFYGMGYISNDSQISDPSQLKELLSRFKSNHYSMQLLTNFITLHPNKVKIVKKLAL